MGLTLIYVVLFNWIEFTTESGVVSLLWRRDISETSGV